MPGAPRPSFDGMKTKLLRLELAIGVEIAPGVGTAEFREVELLLATRHRARAWAPSSCPERCPAIAAGTSRRCFASKRSTAPLSWTT